MKQYSLWGGVLLAALLLPCPAPSCTLCGGVSRPTLVKEAVNSRVVFHGIATSSQISTDGREGSTSYSVQRVVKDDGIFGGRKTIQLEGYTPILDRNNPPHLLICLDSVNGELKPRTGKHVKNGEAATYLEQSLKAETGKRTEALLHYFRWLAHPDPAISEDAFLEFARANDQDVGEAARQLQPANVRKLLLSTATPTERLGLLAFLLGACGTEQDARLLKELIDRPNARFENALDGLLCGLIHMHPKVGWDQVAGILSDRKRGFTQQLAAARVLKFYHAWKPADSRPQVLRCMEIILNDVEIADLAVDDLRRWEIWDFTPKVVALHGSTDKRVSPILRMGVLRYALCCPRPEARRLVEEMRKRDPETVRDLEEQLAFEKSAR